MGNIAGIGRIDNPGSGGRIKYATCAITAVRTQIRCAGIIIIHRYTGRPGCRSIVIQDQSFAGIGTEINQYIGTFGRSERQTHFINIANPEGGRIGYIGDRLRIDYHRLGEETTFGSDLQEAWSKVGTIHAARLAGTRIRHAAVTAIHRPVYRPVIGGSQRCRCGDHLHFRQIRFTGCCQTSIRADIPRRRIGDIE